LAGLRALAIPARFLMVHSFASTTMGRPVCSARGRCRSCQALPRWPLAVASVSRHSASARQRPLPEARPSPGATCGVRRRASRKPGQPSARGRPFLPRRRPRKGPSSLRGLGARPPVKASLAPNAGRREAFPASPARIAEPPPSLPSPPAIEVRLERTARNGATGRSRVAWKLTVSVTGGRAVPCQTHPAQCASEGPKDQ